MGVGSLAVVIQARMGSSRLPGKTLESLGSQTVLDWVTLRAASASMVDEVIVATSDRREDDAIAAHLEDGPCLVVRGSAEDVLARFGVALSATDAARIVRITADCPFVDPGLLDHAIASLGDHDYVATGLDGRFPRGFDMEVMTRTALEVALAESTDRVEREHVTPFIVRRPDRFDQAPIEAPPWVQRAEARLTVDEAADLEAARAVVDSLGRGPLDLAGAEIIDFLDRHPEIKAINASVEHRNVT